MGPGGMTYLLYGAFVIIALASLGLKIKHYRASKSAAIGAQICGIAAGTGAVILTCDPIGSALDHHCGIPGLHDLLAHCLLITWATGLHLMLRLWINLWAEDPEKQRKVIVARGVAAAAVMAILVTIFTRATAGSEHFGVVYLRNDWDDTIYFLILFAYLGAVCATFFVSCRRFTPYLHDVDPHSARGLQVILVGTAAAVVWVILRIYTVIGYFTGFITGRPFETVGTFFFTGAGLAFIIGVTYPHVSYALTKRRHT